jgi:hypothetical protein
MATALRGGRCVHGGFRRRALLAAVAAAGPRHRPGRTGPPFYRYEISTRVRRVQDLPWTADLRDGSPVELVQYTQVDEEPFQIMRLSIGFDANFAVSGS